VASPCENFSCSPNHSLTIYAQYESWLYHHGKIFIPSEKGKKNCDGSDGKTGHSVYSGRQTSLLGHITLLNLKKMTDADCFIFFLLLYFLFLVTFLLWLCLCVQIKAYLMCSKLRPAYLLAVKLEPTKAGPLVQDVLQVAEGAQDSVMQNICRQWLSEHNKSPQQRQGRPSAR